MSWQSRVNLIVCGLCFNSLITYAIRVGLHNVEDLIVTLILILAATANFVIGWFYEDLRELLNK